ncbi:hypothetical protein KsCSTR_36450 [Candidatus Kuenenia stuttgartiensis]|uniref:Uncharacterized protein n=1 Tax=Kuenenia stuttgartiensis TaxID=174633 RepID=Q1Q6H4_KUEST|nr:hypothetical protein KsCSTR_36450 [Candidatus Kuenenia stuttgartiensis]CAJ73176.1 unknown protein [Candidatus Kuenenia stuttgartiensis]
MPCISFYKSGKHFICSKPIDEILVTIQRDLLNYRRSERNSLPNLVLNIVKYMFGNEPCIVYDE